MIHPALTRPASPERIDLPGGCSITFHKGPNGERWSDLRMPDGRTITRTAQDNGRDFAQALTAPTGDRTSDEPRQSLSTQGQEDAPREEQGGNDVVGDVTAEGLADVQARVGELRPAREWRIIADGSEVALSAERERYARAICRVYVEDTARVMRIKVTEAWISSRVESRWKEYALQADAAIKLARDDLEAALAAKDRA